MTGRYAIVRVADDTVLNVIVLEEGANYRPPDGCRLELGREWPQPDPLPPPPLLPAASFLPQDLLASLSADDSALIRPAVAANDDLWLLWQSLVGQRDPIDVASDRCTAGFAALTTLLGEARIAELKRALNLA